MYGDLVSIYPVMLIEHLWASMTITEFSSIMFQPCHKFDWDTKFTIL